MATDPITAITTSLATSLMVKLITATGNRVQRRLKGSRKQKALRYSLEKGLTACLRTIAPPDVWKKERYEAVFRHFMSMDIVTEEFVKLIDPDPDDELDIERLEHAFHEAGYEPEHFPGVDFPAAMRAFAKEFFNAASHSKELQSAIKIRKLQRIIRGLDSITPAVKEIAETSKQTAEKVTKIADYYDRLAQERGKDPSELVRGKLVAYVVFGFDRSVASIAQAFQLITGKSAEEVKQRVESGVKEYTFTSMEQYNAFLETMKVIFKRYDQQPVKNVKLLIKLWSDEVIHRAAQEASRIRRSRGRSKRRRRKFQPGLGDENLKYIVIGIGENWVPFVDGLFMFDSTLPTQEVKRDAEEAWFEDVPEVEHALNKITEIVGKAKGNVFEIMALVEEASFERLRQRIYSAIDEAFPEDLDETSGEI